MWPIIIFLLLLIAAAAAYLACLDGSYEVRRSRSFPQSREQLFDKIRDFKSWSDWSPWLLHEPETRLEFSENCDQEGGYYRWDGQRVGAGTLTHVKFERPARILQRIEFTRPFKSVCEVAFELSEQQGETQVNWLMRGKMPFLLRFMTAKTVAMISKDYDLGLAMLAGQLDENAEHPRISFEGNSTRSPQYCLCQAIEGGLETIRAVMQTDFPRLVAFAQAQNRISGAPLNAYQRVDPLKLYFTGHIAVPVERDAEPGEYQAREVGGGLYFKVSLRGNYQFLELAWYAAKAHLEMRKIKVDRQRELLEVYENDPRQVNNSNDLLTTLYIPIRA